MVLRKKTLSKAYDDALEYFDDNYAWFLTHVLNVGYPVANPMMPTACVFWNDQKKKLEFHINPALVEMDTPEFAFIIAHEIMHARLGHAKYLTRFPDHQKANI